MKYKIMLSCIILLGFMTTGSTAPATDAPGQEKGELIRLHVLANSDSESDQALKYRVKDAIVEEIKGKFAQSESLESSRKILLASLPQVKNIAEETLTSLGSDYTVKTQYGRFDFPTKYYGSFSLPAGEYEAVRVVIGEGKGANWWCVLFPPLCFVETDKDKEKENHNSIINGSYSLNSPEKFKTKKLRVSFKLVEWIKNSLPTLAKILAKG